MSFLPQLTTHGTHFLVLCVSLVTLPECMCCKNEQQDSTDRPVWVEGGRPSLESTDDGSSLSGSVLFFRLLGGSASSFFVEWCA